MVWPRTLGSTHVLEAERSCAADRGEVHGRVNSEPVGLAFKSDGWLAYVVFTGGKTQVMRLVYRIEGDALVTDQRSSPHDERSVFRLRCDELTITFGAEECVFC